MPSPVLDDALAAELHASIIEAMSFGVGSQFSLCWGCISMGSVMHSTIIKTMPKVHFLNSSVGCALQFTYFIEHSTSPQTPLNNILVI